MTSSATQAAAPAYQPTEAELANADELGRQLVRFMRLITHAKSQVAKQGPDGIERAAYALLFTLVHEGPQRTSKLAESLHSDISTISRQTSALVQHGLVERTADPEDGRACLLAVTPEGMRVFEENRRQRNQWLARVVANWPDEDRATLNLLFDRLNDGIEETIPQLAGPSSAQQTNQNQGDRT